MDTFSSKSDSSGNGETALENKGGAGEEGKTPFHAASVASELQKVMGSLGGADEDGNSGMLGLRLMAVVFCRLQQLSENELNAVIDQFPETEREGMRQTVPFLMRMLGDAPGTEEEFATSLAKAADAGAEPALLQQWAGQNPAAALGYWQKNMAAIDPPQWLRDATSALFHTVSQIDARLAVRAALEIPDEKTRAAALRRITLHNFYSGPKSSWPSDGGEMLSAIARAAPDSRGETLRYALTARLKQETPEESLAWIESLDLGAESREWTDRALAGAWSGKDRAEAGDWLVSRAAPEAKAGTVENIVRQWTLMNLSPDDRHSQPEPDLAACADWLQKQGITSETGKGVAVLAEAWIDAGEPAAAIAWAQAVPDPVKREETLRQITSQLRLRYPDTWEATLRHAEAHGPAAESP